LDGQNILFKNGADLVPDILNDEEIIKGLKQGSEAAQLLFVRRFAPCIRAFLKKRIHRLLDADADDIIQEAFYNVISKVKTFEPGRGAKFSTWVFQIAKNAAADWLRKKAKHAGLIQYNEEIAGDLIQPPDYEELTEEGMLVREALSRLDDFDRQILEWRSHDVPIVEIAKYLGIEEGTARQRKLRALAKLKSVYKALSK
jgi:RNA polymerase sigma-70 factor (ECF subfamily)